jgi:NADPH2:quinone reductase
MNKFRAYRIDEKDGKIVAGFATMDLTDLTLGDVVIRVSHSSINYKDALAATRIYRCVWRNASARSSRGTTPPCSRLCAA